MQVDGSVNLMSSCACILINESFDEIGSFFSRVFGCPNIVIGHKPLPHGIISLGHLGGDQVSSLLLIDRRNSPHTAIESFESFAVKQIFLFVKDPVQIQNIATQHGAQVTESNIDYEDGGQVSQSKKFCTLEGPGGIIINVLSLQLGKGAKCHEIILNIMQSRIPDVNDDDFSHVKTRETAKTDVDVIPRKPERRANPARIYFPTLKVEILSKGQYISCSPNPKYPMPFETEYFRGVMMLLVRTNPVDPLYKKFFENPKKNFEFQVQGKFLTQPKGDIFAGAESTTKLELGIIPRSIAKAVLNFLSSFIPKLQSSFGDSQTAPDFQYPHVVAPMFICLERVVVTPPDQSPPPMGVPFVEDAEYCKIRKKFRTVVDANIDLESTYSFSVSTSNLDLLKWQAVGIPMVRPVDLRPFIGDSPIRIVAYELPKELQDKNVNVHPHQSLNYFFCVKLTHIDSDEAVDMSLDDDDLEESDNDGREGAAAAGDAQVEMDQGQDVDIDDPNQMSTLGNRGQHGSKRLLVDDEDGVEDNEDEYDDDQDSGDDLDIGNEAKATFGDQLARDNQHPKQSRSSFFQRDKGVSGAVRNWFRRKLDPVPAVHEIPETSEYALYDHAAEVAGDLRYCPASIEISDNRGELGRRRVVYLLPWNEDMSQKNISSSETYNELLVPRLRTYAEICKALPMASLPKLQKNKKFSEEEKRRRQIVETYRVLLQKVSQSAGQRAATTNPLHTLLSRNISLDDNFLMKPSDVLYIKSVNNKNDHWEGCIATARASRHWIEKYLILSKKEAVIVKNVGTKRNPLVIPLISIICVTPLSRAENPFQCMNFAFFQIETTARVHYVMVRTDKILMDWLRAFQAVLSEGIVHLTPIDLNRSGLRDVSSTSYLTSSHILSNDLDDEAYIGRPCDWKLDKRRIFNYRKIFFHPNNIPASYHHISPTKLVENILMKAFVLSEITERTRENDPRLWIEFSNEISILQIIDVSKLTETEKVAFFLNLYHIMLLHGIIVLGLPLAWVNWQSFFNTVTYIIDCDIVSIAELEQNILRAAMSKSSMLFSKTIAPQSVFPTFAIKQRDFRLNFCINNGSASMASCVPIFRSDILDRQLDEMTSLMLSETFEIDSRKKVITLPKICSAYMQDFSANKTSKSFMNSVSPMDCVRVLAPYLNNSDRRALVKLLSEGHNPSVKFRKFNFSCRRFELYQQSVNED